jgi:hypothetical protein
MSVEAEKRPAKKARIRDQLDTEADRKLYGALWKITWGYMDEPEFLEPDDKKVIKEAIISAIETKDVAPIIQAVDQYDQFPTEPHHRGDEENGYEHNKACLCVDLEREIEKRGRSDEKAATRNQLKTDADRKLYDTLREITWAYMEDPAHLEPETERAVRKAILDAVQDSDADHIIEAVEKYDLDHPGDSHPRGNPENGHGHNMARLRVDLEAVLYPRKHV